jgi:altronate dehydratase
MPKQKKSVIVMSPDDNCATTLEDVSKNTKIQISNTSIKINHTIPLGHKIALLDIKKGELVKKYGQAIGFATENISKGDWIHTHNLSSKYIMEMLKNE